MQHGAHVDVRRGDRDGELDGQLVARRGLVAHRLDAVEKTGRGRQARVDAGQGAAIGLVGTLRRLVCGVLGERQQFGGDLDQQVGERQFAPQFMHFGLVVAEGGGRLQAQGFAQDIGGDEGVAVTVAADPGAHAKEGGQGPDFFRVALLQLLGGLDVEARQFGEEGFVEVGNTVLDLVDDLQPHRAQHARLPQGEDRGAQRPVVLGLLFRRHLQAFALFKQAGDVAVVADQALALHLGRVCGEYGGDQGMGEEIGDGVRRDLGGRQRIQRKNQAALARRRARQVMGATPADVVLVLGDIGQLQEVGKCADDSLRRITWQGIEQGGQFGAGGRVVVAGKAHRCLADTLDDREDGIALLLTYGIAENAAEQADVVAEGFVLVGVERVQVH